MALEVALLPPVTRPTGMNEHSLSTHVIRQKCLSIDGARLLPLHTYQNPLKIGELCQPQLGQVMPIRITMKWTIEIGARVGSHLDLADLEGRIFSVDRTRVLAAEKVAD